MVNGGCFFCFLVGWIHTLVVRIAKYIYITFFLFLVCLNVHNAVHPSSYTLAKLVNCPFDDVHFSIFLIFYYFSFSIRLRHMELCVVQIMDKIFHFLWWHMWAWVCERMATHFYLGSFSSAWTITMMWLFLYHLFVDSFLLNIFYGLRWWCHHYFIFLLVWNSVFFATHTTYFEWIQIHEYFRLFSEGYWFRMNKFQTRKQMDWLIKWYANHLIHFFRWMLSVIFSSQSSALDH